MRAKKDNKISELQRIVRKYDISMKDIAKNTGIKYCTVYYYVKTPFKYKPESDIYDTVYKIIMDVANKHNEVVNLEYNVNSTKEKEIESTDFTKEKEIESTDFTKEKEIESTDFTKEKEIEFTDSTKEKEIESTDSTKEKNKSNDSTKEKNKSTDLQKFNTVINNINKIKLQGHNFTRRPLIKRGDIFYINNGESHDSEQFAGRPAIIVGNEEENKYSPVIKVVYCTTKTKTKLPTHVMINSTKYNSTVLCEQITSVSINRVGHYIGSCTKAEMSKIDKALAISLQIEDIKKSENVGNIKEEIVNIEPTNKIIENKETKDNDMITTEKLKTLLELERTKVEAEIYKKFYNDYMQLQMKKL